MEVPKPKVPPRSSLLKKPVTENGDNNATNKKPVLPSKPRTLPPKPISSGATVNSLMSNPTNTSKVNQTAPSKTQSTSVPKDKSASVKVYNKLNINASDLNKLR